MLTPVTFNICRKFGFRRTMFAGALLYGLGLFTSSFVPSIPYLYLTFGAIFAMGESLCFSASLLILPEYFTKNWSLAHGIALCGNSMGALALAPILEVILTKYGFKRGFQIASAASIYLMLASFFYKRPSNSQTNQQNAPTNENQADEDDQPVLPLKKNKAFITFITATTLMHFGYYIPFVHLVGITIIYSLRLPGKPVMGPCVPFHLFLSHFISKALISKALFCDPSQWNFHYPILTSSILAPSPNTSKKLNDKHVRFAVLLGKHLFVHQKLFGDRRRQYF